MRFETEKVTARHLARDAYLYVRQSTVRQVVENTESTERQYALRQRAVALGWPLDHVIVIDSDLGQSGASAADREGFQRLVSEVGLGRAGIVLGLEVSRLARNSSDWHRLLELCALTDTLILDEDGIYDPAQFNDRLLLGLKGTMSEAELHVLRARMRGGLLNKARRGELRYGLPVGLVYDADGHVALDPDKQVQESIRLLFQTFTRLGSAHATVKYFGEQKLLFPTRLSAGSRRGELAWGRLSLGRAVAALRNPRYAGAYVFGRGRYRKLPDGRIRREQLPPEQWHTLLRDAHPGYISWEEHQRIGRALRVSAKAHGLDYRERPPREGPALLAGRVLCGICGCRMVIHYHYARKDGNVIGTIPSYVCRGAGRDYADPFCQTVLGTPIDAAIGELLVNAVSPMAIDTALAVQREIQARIDDADRLRRRQVERAQYEADRARQRYMQVDPANRLVADSLEADWNEKLRALADAQDRYQQQRAADGASLSEEQRQRIVALASNFPALWRDPRTPHRERKRMLALLIEDITIIKKSELTLHVRYRGGATTTLTVPRPLTAWERRMTHPDARARIDALAKQHTDQEIATILNSEGFRTGAGAAFDVTSVKWVRYSNRVADLKARLRASGLLTTKEICARLGVSRTTIGRLRDEGSLKACICNGTGEWLYEPPPPGFVPIPKPRGDLKGRSTAQGAV
jgi:excisionase family DNA binding protein